MNNLNVVFKNDKYSVIKGDSWVYTDSLSLSDVISYDHKEVLKRIRKVLEDYNLLSTRELNSPVNETDEYINKNTNFTYAECFYKDLKGELRPYYKLSKDLLVLVIFSFRKLPKAQEIQKAYIAKFNEMEKELHWWRARYLGIDVRNEVTDAIKEYIEDAKWYDYKNFTDLIYKSLFGKSTKVIRNERGLKKNTNIRPHLSSIELEQVKALESEMAVLLSYGFNYEKISNMMKIKYKKLIKS
ncbi:Rha family transcriptional regulator [Paenibacillus sp. ALE1]